MNSYDAYDLTHDTGVSSLELEKIISQDYSCSWRYAYYILKGRFELGENIISKNKDHALFYNDKILNFNHQ